jgi:hypothetical protein
MTNPMRRLAVNETVDNATTHVPAVDAVWSLVELFGHRARTARAKAAKSPEEASRWLGSAKAWEEAAHHLRKVVEAELDG